MLWIELLVLGSLFTTAWVFYRCGKRDGYDEGFIDGNNRMVHRMKPSGAVRIVPPVD